MIDLHAHVLPGVDDGPKTLEEALNLLQAAADDGVTAVAATPHVRHDWPTTVERMERELTALREAVRDRGIAIAVLPGGELDLEYSERLSPEARAGFGLGGNPRLLLLEFPYSGWPLGLGETVFQLRSTGIVPVLAHPERNAEVQAAPERLEHVVRGGAIVQLTAASVDGRLGSGPRKCAQRLVLLELAHLLASDAHGPAVRGAGLAAAAASLGPIGRWMVDDVPAALLDGRALPPRPAASRSRLPWRRRP